MTIKRTNTNTLTFENSQNKSSVIIKSLDGQLLIKVALSSSEVEITKPGDYEYFGLSVAGFEIPVEKYMGIINLIRLNMEDVKIVVISKYREIPKELLSNLANIDILVMPLLNGNSVKEITSDIDPKKLIIIKSFEGSEEIEIDSIKKTLGLQVIEEVTSSKSKALDFEIGSEDIILSGEILI